MALALPTSPAFREASPRLVRFGGDLTPPLGGPVTRLNRLGDRFACDFSLPPLTYDVARVWIGRLVRGAGQLVKVGMPQYLTPAATTAPVVDGAGQAGSTLAVKNLSAGYLVREGQFFNILQGGEQRLYQLAADAAADGAGEASWSIFPMLRQTPADEAAIEILAPVIEGWLQGREIGWTLDVAQFAGLSFTIAERA